MLCFVPVLRGCVWYVCCYVRKKALLVCVFVGFWDRDYVSQLPCVRYYVLLRVVLNIFVRNASPRGQGLCVLGA